MNLSRVGFARKLRKTMSVKDMDRIQHLKSLLTDAKQIRRTTREGKWEDNEKRYVGDYKRSDAEDPTADFIVVNKTFSSIETIIPFITGGEIEFIVEPFSSDSSAESARMVSIWLNRMWRSNDMDGDRIKSQAAWDSVVYGDGFLQPMYEITQTLRRGPNGEPIVGSKKDIAEFSLFHVSPWDVWIDRFARGLWDASWYIRRIVVPYDETQEDDNLAFKDHITPRENFSVFEKGRFYSESWSEGERKCAVLYEYWDKKTGDLITFSEESEYPHRWLRYTARNLVQIPAHRIPGLPYHMSDIEQITALQDELNKTRSQMITQRRRNIPKIAYDKDSVSPETINALASSIIWGGIPINASQGNIDDLIKVIAPPPITEDTYNVAAIISADIDELTGVNEYLRGVSSATNKTATEASIVEGTTNTKIKAKVAGVERAIRECGQILLEMAGEVLPTTEVRELELYLTGQEAMQVLQAQGKDIYDEQGDPLDTTLTPEPQLFQGKYEVFVTQGSTELRNPLVREQRMRTVYETLANTYPLLQQAGVIVSLRRVLQLWLEAAGIVDINSILNDPSAAAAFEQQMIAQQMMGMPPGAGAPPGIDVRMQGGVPGGPDQTGQPNPNAAAPPLNQPDGTNSGMLGPDASLLG